MQGKRITYEDDHEINVTPLSPPVKKPCKISAVMHDHSYAVMDSPKKLKKKTNSILDSHKKIKKKLKASQKKARRRYKKIESLKKVVDELKQKKFNFRRSSRNFGKHLP